LHKHEFYFSRAYNTQLINSIFSRLYTVEIKVYSRVLYKRLSSDCWLSSVYGVALHAVEPPRLVHVIVVAEGAQ